MKEVVDGTTPIAEAAAREAWPTKKILLAVLPPTLALFSVMVGVWDNGRLRAEEAEKDRAAAAEAEEVRAEEAESDLRLRRSELVLPKYEQLLVDIHAVTDPIEVCLATLNDYFSELDPEGNAPIPLPVMGEEPDPDHLLLPSIPPGGAWLAIRVPKEVVETCNQINAGIDKLSLSLDQALLVSDDELKTSAEALESALVRSSDGADALLGYVRDETENPRDQIFTVDYTPSPPDLFNVDDGYGGRSGYYILTEPYSVSTEDGKPLLRTAAELNSDIFAIPGLADKVIAEAREQILQLADEE